MDPDRVRIGDLERSQFDAAAGVLARGMRDNPLHVAAYGGDAERRLLCHGRLMSGLFTTFPAQQPIAATLDGQLVGVAGVAPPGTCQPEPAQAVRMGARVLSLGPRTALRVRRWTSRWSALDPDRPHGHLGPLAVDAHLQGQGIGSLLMREHCRRLDASGQLGYLETDKSDNVRFYERFGYEVAHTEPVIGVPNWFMLRAPA